MLGDGIHCIASLSHGKASDQGGACDHTKLARKTCGDHVQIAQLNPKQQQPSLSRGAVEHLFSRYRDQHHEAILAEGVGRLCDDLEVIPQTFLGLCLALLRVSEPPQRLRTAPVTDAEINMIRYPGRGFGQALMTHR